MKKISVFGGRFVPGCTLLLVLMALYSFAPAHPPSSAASLSTEQIQHPITGTVYDIHKPMPGVKVSVKGSSTTTVTDENGFYSIPAEPGDILVFSYPGYETVEVIVGDQLVIDIELYEAIALEEAVINAGYYTVKDKERTGSISKITSKDIEIQPVTNVLATLQGRMAGVEILQETGVPGGGFNIKIRGQSSLREDGNSPLYVVDGVPYSSETTGSYLTSSTLFPSLSSPLNSINPDAIESIEVLKDADATAIYGSRGANGVVLITTKKGKAGKTRVTLNTSTGAGWITRFMNMMNTEEYLRMRALAFQNDGITEYPTNAYDLNGIWDQNRYTNWQKELTGGIAQLYSLQGTLSGGSEQTRFMAGGNYNSQTTVFPGDFIYKKGGVNMSVNHHSADKRFSLVLSGNYNIQNNNQPSTDLTSVSRRLAPNAPALYDENGELNWENNTWTNPLAALNGQFKSRTNDLNGNAVVAYQLFPSLEVKTSVGYTDTRNREERVAPSSIFNPSFGLGPEYSSLYLNQADRSSWIIEPQISYRADWGEGELNVLLGTTFQQQQSNYLTTYGIGFSSNALIHDLASASTKFVDRSNEFIYKYQAFYGRINYNWKQRYVLNLTGRRDGSSRFGPGNQFAYFGAVGAAWIFSNENFLENNSIISFGKLRGSYGTSGNDQIGDYQFLDTYSTGGIYQGIIGLSPSRLFNPNFQWEVNKKLEAALEIGLFKDRIFFTGSYYRHRSSNQLTGMPLPGTTGFTSMQANQDATVQNTGFEFTLRTLNLNKGDFKWTSNLNLTVPRTKLIAFPDLERSAYKDLYRIGESLNIELVYHYTGIDPETGIYQFEDVNGDGQISFPDDRQTVADLSPRFFGGFQNQVIFKRWTLDFLFQFTKQKNRAYMAGNAGTMVNQPSGLLNSWQYPGHDASYQILTTGINQEAVMAQSFYASSDAAIVDASFIRLKNISFSYRLPLEANHIQCQLYIQAQNLFTITPYKYGDPEFGQMGFLPPLKVISTGIQLTF